MRIGIYNPYLDGLTGGEKYMLTLASCLSEKHEVMVLWDDKSILQKASQKLGINLSKVGIAENIFSAQISLKKRLLASREYDSIVYLSDGSIPLVLSKLFIHFQFPVEWVQPTVKQKIKIARVQTIFCNSFFTKQYIDKKFNVKSEVLYPPVTIQTTKSDKENIVLNVGRFGRTLEGNNYKKQDIMIEAFKKIIDNGIKNWKFVLVMSVRKEDEERLEELKKLAHDYPIDFIINPSHSELWKMYTVSKIYWHASGYGEDLNLHPEYAEHFGITTVEAMGAGAVPVVINAGGQKEIVEDNKTGILWNSLEELVNKTEELMKDKKLITRLAKDAQVRAQDFTVDKFRKKLFEFIDE